MKLYKVNKKKSIWKRKEILWSVFIIIIMVSSAAGFLWTDQSAKLRYNDLNFEKTDQGWKAEVGGKERLFTYHPSQLEDINITGGVIQKIKNAYELDLTSDEKDSSREYIASIEYNMITALMDEQSKFIRTGFDAENKVGAKIITCNNATKNVPVVYFKTSNITAIHEDGDCIIIESVGGYDFLRAWERIYYSLLDVMK